jgi:hypothetical protein
MITKKNHTMMKRDDSFVRQDFCGMKKEVCFNKEIQRRFLKNTRGDWTKEHKTIQEKKYQNKES